MLEHQIDTDYNQPPETSLILAIDPVVKFNSAEAAGETNISLKSLIFKGNNYDLGDIIFTKLSLAVAQGQKYEVPRYRRYNQLY